MDQKSYTLYFDSSKGTHRIAEGVDPALLDPAKATRFVCNNTDPIRFHLGLGPEDSLQVEMWKFRDIFTDGIVQGTDISAKDPSIHPIAAPFWTSFDETYDGLVLRTSKGELYLCRECWLHDLSNSFQDKKRGETAR